MTTQQLEHQNNLAVTIEEKELRELERQAEIHNFAETELLDAEDSVKDLQARKVTLDETSKVMTSNITRLTNLQAKIDSNREDLGRVIHAKLELIQSLRKSKV